MAESDVLRGELADLQSRQQNPLSLYNEAQAKLGVPEVRGRVSGLRKQVLDTENLLNAVEGSVTGRTQGSLVTEAQRQRLTALERQPLAGQASQFQGALTNEGATLADLMGQASTSANLGYEGQKTKEEGLRYRLEQALSREDEQRRQFEADRAFNAQQQENARAAAERATAAKSSSKASSGGKSSAASTKANNKATAFGNLASVASANIIAAGANSANKSNFWTEKVLMPKLYKQFGGALSKDEINYVIYEQRKKLWGS